MYAYSTGFQSRHQILTALKGSQDIVLALHSAAEALKCKNTNLDQLELYLLQPNLRLKLEKTLKLNPKERGYDVLLIEPYYKSMLDQDHASDQLQHSSALLTFLDLYHFPLRGIEQAEYIAQKIPQLKQIYKKNRKND